jgi:hypothetical protein
MKVYLIDDPNKILEVLGHGWECIHKRWVFYMKGGQTYPIDKCVSLPEDCINCEDLRQQSINNLKY